MGHELFETAEQFLPKYLSPEQRKQLFEELNSFPEGFNPYFENPEGPDLLQGDVWERFSLVELADPTVRQVPGILISNSCDVDTTNDKGEDRRVLFAPLLPVKNFEKLLQDNGYEASEIEAQLLAIRSQHIARIFHLPARGVFAERIVFLDNIHPQPLGSFLATRGGRLVRLSQLGHYLLLLKLSIHFTRFNEGVARFAAA